MTISMRRSIATAALGAFALLAAPVVAAHAQQSNGQTPPAATQLDPGTVKAFAEASLKVEELNKKWAPRLAEAEGQDQVQALREEATTEMTQAVQSSGLSVEDYNKIYRAAQQDQALASRIQELRQNAN
ncbi:DUF4168 domain-containing protein [Kaustia mangrovi]|uniref:DUF4168 domain-containing protein n=1 Tax=Kaustia mangrovi TaxID=2593653 RepID=A0A7S8HC26_9HYPH|nr:DUF4168 domain-containing protein [Kaustia mangrovi]QPC43171.1 DUF4168 domain-containing protein [Kaustia mangrovi]